MKEFKIRSSATSKIMAGEIGLTEKQEFTLNELLPRSKGVGKPLTSNMENDLQKLLYKRDNPELPKGAKTYCETWIKKHIYNRNPEFKSLVIDKGLMCEMDGIKLIAETFGYDKFEKNDEYFENVFMHGTPDIIHEGVIHDTKLSWDLFSFPMFEKEIPNDDYWWQLQSYMILSGVKKASLDYVLIDTPMPLILLDLKKLYFQSGGVADEWTPEKYEALYPNYQFNDIPAEKRIKSFTFDLDTTIEAKINERVLLCRKYINELLNGK